MNFFWGEINKEQNFLNEVFPEEKKQALNRIYEVVYYKNFAKLLSATDGFLYMLKNYDNNLDINTESNINNIREKLKYTFEIFISNELKFYFYVFLGKFETFLMSSVIILLKISFCS